LSEAFDGELGCQGMNKTIPVLGEDMTGLGTDYTVVS
jgi:hypothetical protein